MQEISMRESLFIIIFRAKK